MTYRYYDTQIQKLGDQSANIQLRNAEGQTNWMTITPEQVQAILAILNKNEAKEWSTPPLHYFYESFSKNKRC